MLLRYCCNRCSIGFAQHADDLYFRESALLHDFPLLRKPYSQVLTGTKSPGQVNPKDNPDVICDARQLTSLPGSVYDSVYCSHNLEHYYRHDVEKVLAGFVHVLKDDGFAYIRVPDMGELFNTIVKNEMDIDDFLYQSALGPITIRDVIYGYGLEIEQSGKDFYAHKTGFTQKSLYLILQTAGFPWVYISLGPLEFTAFAFKNEPGEYAEKLLNLPSLP